MVEAALKVEGISKSFGSFAAVREVSFDAAAGEVIGLLGPNGAGKTTTIRVLSTILKPTSGRFSVNDISHERPRDIRRSIGVLPESSGYPSHWTGVELLTYYGRLYGYSTSTAKERSLALLADVGLSDRASSVIGIYSRGMRQRLGVARALLNQPRVLFLDEPTLGLDPAGQRQMLQLIRQIAIERGAAVILSTHFLDEVEEVCSRILILNRGAVIADGTVAEVKKRAAPRSLRICVDAGFQEKAVTALGGLKGVSQITPATDEPGCLGVGLDSAYLGRSEQMTNASIRALLDADIPILSLQPEGGRLSDAFLALTGGSE